MRLKNYILESIAKAENEERLRKLIGSRDKWDEVVDVFFKHVEGRYLNYYLTEKLITISHGKNSLKDDQSLCRSELNISFGKTKIKFLPIFSPTQSSLGIIDVRVNHNTDRDSYFICDLNRGWLAPTPETGLRRALIRYLPEKLVTLDEHLFDDILCDLLSVSEPFFTYDKERVLYRLSHLLNDILDPSRKEAIYRFIDKVSMLPSPVGGKNFGRAMKTVGLLRLSNSRDDASRLIAQYREAETDEQPTPG